MKIMKHAVTAISLLVVSLGLSVQGVNASELTDAESKVDQLRQSFESDTYLLNVTLRGYELDAANCIKQYLGQTSPEAVALRNDCQTALDRTQADIFSVTRRAVATESQITSLRALIEKLKSTPAPTESPTPSVSESANSAVVSKNSDAELMSSTPINTKASTSVVEKIEPSPSVSSTTNVAPSPEPRNSKTPAALPKATASPKPTPKLTTIICVKGKTSKKVTDVNPKCPAGYKKK